MAGSWVWDGETAGESRALTEAGVVDGGAYRHRSLIEGIDAAVLPFFSEHALWETLDPVSLELE
jgi:hypothetical protein